MNQKRIDMINYFVLMIFSVFLCTSAFAEKHDKSNHHRGDHAVIYRDYHNRDGGYRDNKRGERVGVYFGDQHRTYVHEYYQEEFHSGHCPPGLAMKNNGCMPPGQLRTWRRGYPLPRDVIFYDISPSLAIRLGPPPPRHRYIRVAADILLIAIGTGLVVDAIED